MKENFERKKQYTNIQDIYKSVKIDWTNFYVYLYDTLGDPTIPFQVEPIEYLQFAKNGIKKSSNESLINSLTNAKRSIDAQVDLLICALGFDYKKFDNYPNIKDFIKKFYKKKNNDGITEKIKLLNILGLAPTLLISETRHLRNKVEHEYIIPKIDEVNKAIEIADLFINATNRKFQLAFYSFIIGNKSNVDRTSNDFNFPYIYFEFDMYRQSILITAVLGGEKILPHDYKYSKNKTMLIFPEDKDYLEILKIIFEENYDMIPKIFGNSIEEKYIKKEILNKYL
ncbi:hypothetical protein [Maledivibacter halophilus]|uniref:Uncharacterized protein n=1 Tax=Maledivibacter halophilus TaxID=36842 RepID=A0A1T5LBQ6_9FIRM|nr:hypothetical protein [Maledivibacter halophilus]SKC73393.1 hypothetical protein SAMN02194393_02718 [Maledivibacter halophilus]